MEMNKIFKGILQFKSTDAFTKEAGYIYLVREFNGENPTGNAEVWFGTRKYGDVNTTKLAELEAAISGNTDAIALINEKLGEWSKNFSGEIATVAQAVIAVSGATTINTTAIATLNGDDKTDGSVAKAVADAKSDLLGEASDSGNTLGKLEQKIADINTAIETKNVSATGDTYISASAEANKVTVGATIELTNAIGKANSALQAADKTELNNLITAETKAREDAVALVDSKVTALTETFVNYTGATAATLSGLREDVDDNTAKLNAILNGTGVTDALDSFIELQDWIDKHGTEVSGITSAIKANEDAISGLTESKLDITAHTAYTAATADILSGLREDVDAVSGAVANHVTATTEAISTAKEEAISAATAYTNSEVSALTDVVNTKLDISAHTAYTAATQTVLAGIESRLTAITDNAVTSIASSGQTITVTETEGAVNVEVNTLAHEASGQEGYVILNKTDEGALYGVMYYGGDDVE